VRALASGNPDFAFVVAEYEALLRMVDELRAKLRMSVLWKRLASDIRRELRRAAGAECCLRAKLADQEPKLRMALEVNHKLVFRNEELRAKLAEAARIHVEAEVKHAYRVKELEAKLAEVEKDMRDAAGELLRMHRLLA